MDGISELGKILLVQTSHADSPIGCHVNMVFTGHEDHLLLVKPREGKHTNLLNNMAPITRCTFMKTIQIKKFYQIKFADTDNASPQLYILYKGQITRCYQMTETNSKEIHQQK
jgi:hypothetical protein